MRVHLRVLAIAALILPLVLHRFANVPAELKSLALWLGQ